MKIKNKKWLMGTLGALVLLGLILLLSESPSKNTENVELAINTFPGSALIHIAQEKGYFSEQGLNVNYHAFPTGKLALDALIGGGADIATTADVPIALAGLANQKISALATIEYSTDNVQVVARKDSGIFTPKDLMGKKIATTNGGGPLFFTHKFLEKYEMKLSDVKLITLNPGTEMISALAKGDIDAFVVFEPSPSLAKKQIGEDKLTIFSPTDIYGETWNIVVMKDYEKDNKKTTEKFLKALLKADKFLKDSPEESLAIVSKYSGTDSAILRDIMAKQNYGVVLNNVLPDYLNKEAEWAIKQKLSTAKEVPDYSQLIDKEPLTKINPKGVTI